MTTQPQTACDMFVDSNGKPGNIVCLSASDFDDKGQMINFGSVDGVVFIGAEWCGWCKKTKPEFASFSNMIRGQPVRAFFIDAVKNEDLIKKINANPTAWGFAAKGFPTIVGYSKGKYFADYGDDSPADFRTAKSLFAFSQGLGRADVQWQ